MSLYPGSHFVTDVVAGMATGYIVGTVFAHPLGTWKKSLSRAIVNVTTAVVIVTTVTWLILHRIQDEGSNEILTVAGIALIMLGLIIRWCRLYELQQGIMQVKFQEITLLIGLGLSCASGSFVVIGVTMLVVMARWVGDRTIQAGRPEPVTEGSVSKECFYTIAVVLLLVLILQLKGIIPIQ